MSGLALQFINLLAALLLLLAFAMLAQRRILSLIHLYTMQGVVLVAATAAMGYVSRQPHLYVSAGLTLALKVFLIPWLLHRVIENVQPYEQEIQDRSGRWYSMRLRPYRTLENRIEGVVVVMVDINEQKLSERALRESEARFELLADNAPVLIWISDREGYQFVNRAFEEFVGESESRLREAVKATDEANRRISEQNRTLESLASKLSKYLAPQVYRSIFSGEQSEKVSSQRKKLTIFFSDIAGFTETTDLLESEELTTLLNQYLRGAE